MGSGNWTSIAYTSKMAERGIKTTLNSATMSAVADLSGISTSQYYTQRTISDRVEIMIWFLCGLVCGIFVGIKMSGDVIANYYPDIYDDLYDRMTRDTKK